MVQLYLGEAGAGEYFQQAIRLSPLDSRIFVAYSGLAYSHFFAGQYDEASVWAEKAMRESPHYLGGRRIAMASHALSGRLNRAKDICSEAMLMDLSQRISGIRDGQPFKKDEDVVRLGEGFRIAGMPE